MPDPSKTKEYYQSKLKEKKQKVGKTIKNNCLTAKSYKNPNIFGIKSAIIEHPKTSHKLSKIIKQVKKVSQIGGADNHLHGETKKMKIFGSKKNVKITKRLHSYIGYESTYNVKILKSFNPELQLKETEFTTKNKLIDLLSKLRGFKFVRTFVLEFNKIENDNGTKYATFYSNSKAKASINESDSENLFQSVYTPIISNMQIYLGKCSGWVIDSVLDHIINISKYSPLACNSYIKLPKELNHSKTKFD